MASLYQRLFQYRERASRSPREDFLSEALVDLLNRLPQPEMLSFVTEILLARSASGAKAWTRYVASRPLLQLKWHTQKSIHVGGRWLRADIVLQDEDNMVLLLVENKISAGFQHHSSASQHDEQGTVGVDHQLELYGRWLSNHCQSSGWQGALVLLTYQTPAPALFGSGAERFGAEIQSICRWSEVRWWLRKTAGHNPSANNMQAPAVWVALAAELAALLESWDMSTESMTQFDISTAELFAQSNDRIEQSFEQIANRLSPTLDAAMAYARDGWHLFTDGAVIQDSIYLEEPQKRKSKSWSLCWGIRYPTKSIWWIDVEPRLTAKNHIYVCMENSRKGFGRFDNFTDKLPSGWSMMPSGSEIIIARDMSELSGEPDVMNAEMSEWFEKKIKDITPAIVDIRNGAW